MVLGEHLASWLDTRPHLLRGRSVVELGAGAGTENTMAHRMYTGGGGGDEEDIMLQYAIRQSLGEPGEPGADSSEQVEIGRAHV